MKHRYIYITVVLILGISNSIFAQRDVTPEQDSTKKEEKVVKEFKKEQEEYEKKHGKVTPQNKQDSNPKPVVKSNDKIEKKKEQEERKDSMEEAKYKNLEKEEGLKKGNAYGKDKEGLSGREFGLSRAEDARNRINEVQSNFEDKSAFIEASQKKIQRSKERLEEARSNGTIDDEQYAERLNKIQLAQDRMDSLKQTILLSQDRLKALKFRLDSISKNKDELQK